MVNVSFPTITNFDIGNLKQKWDTDWKWYSYAWLWRLHGYAPPKGCFTLPKTFLAFAIKPVELWRRECQLITKVTRDNDRKLKKWNRKWGNGLSSLFPTRIEPETFRVSKADVITTTLQKPLQVCHIYIRTSRCRSLKQAKRGRCLGHFDFPFLLFMAIINKLNI